MDYLLETDADGIATLTLNRPQRRNAFDDALIADVTAAFRQIGEDPAVRALVLTGAGTAFSGGADINWMKRTASYDDAENVADSMRLAEMLRSLDELPKPSVARINGAAFAGGVGLVSCCDIAVAADTALFAVSEVKIGLFPATIAPYVLAAIGPRAARRYFLTGESFSAAEALRIGLVHEVVPAAELDASVARVVQALLVGAPGAQGRAKRLMAEVAHQPITQSLMEHTSRAIAAGRATAEAREGFTAFLEKRRPQWR